MADLNVQFTEAKHRVEATADDKSNAKAAHEDVRGCLETDETLRAYGIDTVLIGSYKRHVAIRRVKDVDVLSKLPGLPRDVGPRQLLEYFVKVLTEEYGAERVEAQSRSVKVEFPGSGLAVDAVPARPCLNSGYIEIPDRAGGWETTNPEALTELTTAMNSRYDDEYVPLVKLIRQTRRHNLAKRPGGFYFEILTYHAANGGLDTRTTAKLFTTALRSIAIQLQSAAAGAAVADPTMPANSRSNSSHSPRRRPRSHRVNARRSHSSLLGDTRSLRSAARPLLERTTSNDGLRAPRSRPRLHANPSHLCMTAGCDLAPGGGLVVSLNQACSRAN